MSRRVGAVSGESLARARLGEALHALGDEVGARANLAEALELAHASALAHHLLFLVHVPILRLERDPAAALALVESSQILLEDQGVCVFCPVAYAIAAASACVRGGELDRADALLARARASASMWPPGSWSPAICEVAGELARARGDEREAATLLRRAVDGYATSGQRLCETARRRPSPPASATADLAGVVRCRSASCPPGAQLASSPSSAPGGHAAARLPHDRVVRPHALCLVAWRAA